MKKYSSNDVVKFIRILIPFCLVLFVFDFIIGGSLKYLYEKQISGLLYRANYAIDSTRAQVLVYGSSRANHHYDASFISSKIRQSVYNCGRDGQGFIYSSAILSAAINRYKPELIIIDILPNEFTFSEEDRLTSLLPYSDNKNIRPYIDYSGDFQNLKLYSKTYPYNSLLTTIIQGVSKKNALRTKDYFGYLPLEGAMQNAPLQNDSENETLIDSVKIKLFNEMLEILEEEKIPNLIVISPIYLNFIEGPTIKTSKKIVSKFKYSKFLNFTNNKEYMETGLFKDYNHLNTIGVQKFSSKISEIIGDRKIELAIN